MKNILSILIAVLSFIAFTGCEDFLVDKPESVLPQIGFYTTETRINQGILGCYAGLTLVMNDEWIYTELRSDNSCVASTGSSSTTRQYLTSFAHFSVIPSEPQLLAYWYNSFQNISNINAVLPAVKDNSYVKFEARRAGFESELRMLRAYHYLTLVNLFGDIFKVTTVIGPNKAMSLPRSPVSEIYDEIIIPDLVYAAEHGLVKQESNDIGRATSWAAKGLLAKAYLMKGGSENLAQAKLLLDEIIKLGGFELEPSLKHVFDPSNEMNDEIIFAVRYKGGGLGVGSPFWEYFAPEGGNKLLAVGTPAGNNSPTLEIMSLFEKDSLDNRKDDTWMLYRRSSTRFYPYTTKYIDENISARKQGENDWIILRLADVILMYAEVLAQDGSYATAHTEVNKIRLRADKKLLEPFESPKMALDSVY